MRLIKLQDLKFLDEVDILYPKPKKIPIGNQFFIVKELPISFMEKLNNEFMRMIYRFKPILSMKFPNNINDLNTKINSFSETIYSIESYLLKNRLFRKLFFKCLKIAMPEMNTKGFISSKYLEKNITMTEALQIMIAIWAYNYTSDCKKKILMIAKEMMEV